MTRTIVSILVNGETVEVPAGISVAAGMMNAGLSLRRSVAGETRAALCGMGICYDCRITINGVPHQRACLVAVASGMRIDHG
jgi:sarcosine oxidase subunit alpha